MSFTSVFGSTLGAPLLLGAVVVSVAFSTARAHESYWPDDNPPTVQTDMGKITKIDASRQGDKVKIKLTLSKEPAQQGKKQPEQSLCSTAFVAMLSGTSWPLTLEDLKAGHVLVSHHVDVDMSKTTQTFDFDMFVPAHISSFPKAGNWTIISHTSGSDPDHYVKENGVTYNQHCHGVKTMPGDAVPRATETVFSQSRIDPGIVDDSYPKPQFPELERTKPGSRNAPPRLEKARERRAVKPAKEAEGESEAMPPEDSRSGAPSEATPKTTEGRAPATPK